MANKTTNNQFEDRVGTLESRINGAENVITTLRGRISDLSDENMILKEDLETTKKMIQQDLQTMMEQIGNRLKNL